MAFGIAARVHPKPDHRCGGPRGAPADDRPPDEHDGHLDVGNEHGAFQRRPHRCVGNPNERRQGRLFLCLTPIKMIRTNKGTN